jgi:5-oxopent-3-ene-1,2,5-tricarboxylate decarboxylase / 2-hydroxyhepta-2,4-diene-1,7-dioate isomerase
MNPSPSQHWSPGGTVYGPLLNFQREFAIWAPRMSELPYKAPPKVPVLYVKTANTFSPSGGTVALAPGADALAVGATIGLVMGEPLPGCSQPRLSALAGCVLLNDWSVPHDSYFRPPVKTRCADGLLGLGSTLAPLPEALEALKIEVRVNGVWRQTVQLADLVRPAAQLLADVSDFMTLQPGDVLMLGNDCLEDGSRPLARAGDTVEISAPGFKPVVHTVVKTTGEPA